MRRYSAQRRGAPVNDRVRDGIPLSINGIAPGLRNTG